MYERNRPDHRSTGMNGDLGDLTREVIELLFDETQDICGQNANSPVLIFHDMAQVLSKMQKEKKTYGCTAMYLAHSSTACALITMSA